MEPTSVESRSCIVKKLLSWNQSDENEIWAEKAVRSLVIKLRWRKDLIEELKQALSCPGTPSKCVTIPRTHDGRIQILHRKELPHMIYCRIWRWPDLKNHHELLASPECQFAFSNKLREVCVNPYHYIRVDPLAQQINFVPGSSPLQFQQLGIPTTPKTLTCTENSLQPQSSNLVELQPRPHNSAYSKLVEELNIDDYEPRESQPPPQYTESQPPPQYTESQAPPQYTESKPPLQLINEPHYWATIAYYELNNHVGDTFNCKSTSIIVDGFTSPDKNGNRFCVGQLSNMYRNLTTERVRRHIGKGIHINYVNGEVHVKCLSNSSIFVQSKVFNHTNKCFQLIVRKISSGSSVKVFDESEFVKLLSDRVNSTYESVHPFTEMCIIQISFVKGWSGKYCRANITSSPAWIEIYLNKPLKWLDRVLVEMGEPTVEIS